MESFLVLNLRENILNFKNGRQYSTLHVPSKRSALRVQILAESLLDLVEFFIAVLQLGEQARIVAKGQNLGGFENLHSSRSKPQYSDTR